jgi:hypothetical protein
MKITNFTFSDNSLVVYFDVEFKQINYVKMESQSNDSHGILECEEMEIKYSKKKNTLNLFVGDVANTIILLITVFDNKDVCYSYYMTKMFEDKQTNMDLMARGFKQLFKGESCQGKNKNTNTTEQISEQTTEMITETTIKIHPIKNQNIFANIKKKV